IVRSRIVDALLVNDQRIGEGTDLQQAIPITARAGQARDFQTQDCSYVAQSYFGNQQLKTVTPNGRSAGLALILVNDLNTCLFPPQIVCAFDQIILSCGATDIFADLQ